MKLSEAPRYVRAAIRKLAGQALERQPDQDPLQFTYAARLPLEDFMVVSVPREELLALVGGTVAVGDSIFDTRGTTRDITVFRDFLDSLEGKTMYVGMVRADRTGCRWQMVEPGEWLCVDREVG